MPEISTRAASLDRRQPLVRVPLVSLIAAVTLLAIACGGPSPEERFFDRVCSTALPRAQEVLEIHESVQLTRAAPGLEARTELLALTIRGVEVARKFRAEVKALLVQDTDAGRKAEPFLELSADTALETMAEEERRVRSLPEDITLLQSIRGLERLELALIFAFTDMTGIRAIAAETELLGPFQSVDSCKELDALGTD